MTKIIQVSFISASFLKMKTEKNKTKTTTTMKATPSLGSSALSQDPVFLLTYPGTSSVTTSQTRCAKPLRAFIPSIFLSDVYQFPEDRVFIGTRTYD